MDATKKYLTVVLGASPKPDRYAYLAQKRLMDAGHPVIPVNPAYPEVLGIPCVRTLEEITGAVDTVTVYVGPGHIQPSIPGIIALKPRRVILNPGTESEELKSALKSSGISFSEACTLVLLSTGQY